MSIVDTTKFIHFKILNYFTIESLRFKRCLSKKMWANIYKITWFWDGLGPEEKIYLQHVVIFQKTRITIQISNGFTHTKNLYAFFKMLTWTNLTSLLILIKYGCIYSHLVKCLHTILVFGNVRSSQSSGFQEIHPKTDLWTLSHNSIPCVFLKKKNLNWFSYFYVSPKIWNNNSCFLQDESTLDNDWYVNQLLSKFLYR